jgi:hypothetical protein
VRLFPLILPSAGASGLPNVAALVEAATPKAAAAAAALASILRRNRSVIVFSSDGVLL